MVGPECHEGSYNFLFFSISFPWGREITTIGGIMRDLWEG